LVEYIVNYYLDIILKIMDEEAENARNRIYEKDLEDFEEMVVFYRESITYFFNSPYIAPYDISFYENQLDNFKNYIYSMDFAHMPQHWSRANRRRRHLTLLNSG